LKPARAEPGCRGNPSPLWMAECRTPLSSKNKFSSAEEFCGCVVNEAFHHSPTERGACFLSRKTFARGEISFR
jgi:hypothetical protein